MTIKAIETIYKGYKFRSRLEARWAVFFDELDVEWEYEKEGFEFGAGERYLPDFWLPKYKLWIEIKGDVPDQEYFRKIESFSDSSGQAIAILIGLPLDNWGQLYAWDLSDSSGGSWTDWVQPARSESTNEFGIICKNDTFVEWKKDIYATSMFENEIKVRCLETFDFNRGHVNNASIKAKQARFEHGAHG